MAKGKFPIVPVAIGGGLLVGGILLASSSASAKSKKPTELPPNVVGANSPEEGTAAANRALQEGYKALVVAASGSNSDKNKQLSTIVDYARNYLDTFFIFNMKDMPGSAPNDVGATGVRGGGGSESYNDTSPDRFKSVLEFAINYARGGEVEETDSSTEGSGDGGTKKDDSAIDTGKDPGTKGGFITGVPKGDPPQSTQKGVLDSTFVNAMGLARSVELLGFGVDPYTLSDQIIQAYKGKAQDDIPLPIIKDVQRVYNTISRARGLTIQGVTIPDTLGGLMVDGFFGYKTQAGVLQLLKLASRRTSDPIDQLDKWLRYIDQTTDNKPKDTEILDLAVYLRDDLGVP